MTFIPQLGLLGDAILLLVSIASPVADLSAEPAIELTPEETA